MADSGLTLLPARLYRARVRHVCSCSLVDVDIMLDFGLRVLQRIQLHDVSFEHNGHTDTAKAALISVCPGSEDIVLEPIGRDLRVGNTWPVIVYRKGNVPAEDCVIGIDQEDYVNVNRYLRWLGERGFPADIVRQHVRILRSRTKDKE
jgi:hypothetical protein